jgi:hypothetical protein
LAAIKVTTAVQVQTVEAAEAVALVVLVKTVM